MTLKDHAQIYDARKRLRIAGVSCLPGPLSRVQRLLRLSPSILVGDVRKSWDLWLTFDYLYNHCARDDHIVDFGAFASELPLTLRRAGFSTLTAIDLNTKLPQMPHADQISYRVDDFLASGLPSGCARAITAISVIEHGLDIPRLLDEVSRVLGPHGTFIASFDYWAQKIDTSGERLFDMTWDILSREQVGELIDTAANHGLRTIGELDFSVKDAVIDYAGYRYTFAWLALER